MQAALAASPIAAVLLLMLLAGWSAARAGSAGLLLALLLWAGPMAGAPDALSLLGIGAEAGFLSLTILWILWPALALHHWQQRQGALEALRAALTRLTPEPLLQALLMAWFLGLFLEGAAGFGTPVALVAPLLVGLGVAPVPAVVLALLGHAAGVGFGALGTPLLTQLALTGLDPAALTGRTALLNAGLAGLMMVFVTRLLRTALPGSALPLRWSLLAVVAFAAPALLIATWLGPELPTLGGALLGGLLFAACLRARWPMKTPTEASGMSLPRALAPYAVLVLLVLATRALPSLSELLRDGSLHWRLADRFEGRFSPWQHPGTLLMLALLGGAWLQGGRVGAMGEALRSAALQLRGVALALLAMLALSRLMLHAGFIDALQLAAVQGLGSAWPWVAPAVGALGSFVTGSATASNVLFASLQHQTAQALGLSAAWLGAAQTLGAGVGNIVCPHNLVAGAATVGLAGREAELLRRTLLPCLLALLLAGLLLALVA